MEKMVQDRHAFVEVRAVVIRFYTTRRVRSIDVEGIEMGADRFNGGKVLTKGQGGFHAIFGLQAGYLCY